MSPEQSRALGIGLIVVGVGLAALALLIAWNGVQRWIAVGETTAALSQLQQGRLQESRRAAAAASQRLPDEALPALLAADLTVAEQRDRLATLAMRTDRRQDRTAALAAVGLARSLAGQTPDVELGEGGDARLLAAIERLRAGRGPVDLSAREGEEPPQLAILVAAHRLALREAWNKLDAPAAAQHAGALLLLRPRVPEAPALRLLVTARSAASDEELLRMAAGIRDGRDAAVRAVAAIVPERRPAFAGPYAKALEGLP
jgi:hypothetical protein